MSRLLSKDWTKYSRPRWCLVAVSDVVLIAALCLWNPLRGWNRCFLSKSIGTMSIDLILLVLMRNLAALVYVGRLEIWKHFSFLQLVYALIKAVGRALGARSSTCPTSTIQFHASCAVFAFMAYLGPSIFNTPKKERLESSVRLSQISTESQGARIALLGTPLLDQEEPTQKKEDLNAEWKRALAGIAKIARRDLGLFLIAMLFAVIAALATSAVSLLTGDALDALIKHGSGKKFKKLVATLAVVATLGALATGVRGGVFSWIGVRINVRIRDKLFRHLLTLELSFYDATPTGELNSRLASDTAKIGDQVSLNSNVLVRTFVQLITTLAFMIHISFPLSLLALASVPVVSIATKRYGEYVWSLARTMQNKLAAAMKVAEEVFATMATVRSCAGERCSAIDFSQALEEYRRVGKKQASAYAAWQIFNTSLPTLMTCLLLYQGGRLVDRGQLESGRLVAFNLLTQTLTDTFSTLADVFSGVFDALGASDKVFALLAQDPDHTDAAPLSPWGKPAMKEVAADTSADGLVEIDNITFRYPGRPQIQVLSGISIRIDPGSVCALVGPSGSGKSSIIALIQRFYAPETGTIRVDGQDVAEFDHAHLHRRVALVSQEPVLFARTIRRNVAYALEDTALAPTEEDILSALQMAHASDFVSNLPEGLETDVGERGLALSGGQKQRIAIARALCRKPRILLLDEATSALDTESERKVQHALDDLIAAHSLTVIVVAHRLSTIQNADSICCIKKGRLIERGTHSELMALPDGVYADLVRRQAVRGAEAAPAGPPPPPATSMKLLSSSNLRSAAAEEQDEEE